MKKFLSFLIAILVFASCLSTIANAVYEDSLIVTECISDMFIIDITGEGISSNTPSYMYQYDEEQFSLGYDCYDYLEPAQKHIYDAIVENVGKLSFTINFPNNLFAYADYTSSFFAATMKALCADRPDVFYYAGYSVNGGTLYSGNKYLKTISYVVQTYDSSYYTSSNLPGYYSALMAAVPTVPVNLSNRYNFIKSVHDYLAENVYYPDIKSSDYKMSAHDAYGALVEGRAVCQGYSDAIKILCDYYNIPCVCISGTTNGGGHMWNAVQMDDGKWYFIDCTWDDQGNNGTYYDFFLVGSKSTNTHYGGKQFSVEHVNDADLPLPLSRLSFSDSAYNRSQNHNTGFGATYNAAADFTGKYLYLSAFDAGKSDVYYNGISVGVTDFSNDVSFTVPSGTNSTTEQWSIVVLGDLNSDGLCNELDYSSAVNLLFTSDDKLNTTAERSCDVNRDGVIDVLDAAVISRASVGLNTSF